MLMAVVDRCLSLPFGTVILLHHERDHRAAFLHGVVELEPTVGTAGNHSFIKLVSTRYDKHTRGAKTRRGQVARRPHLSLYFSDTP